MDISGISGAGEYIKSFLNNNIKTAASASEQDSFEARLQNAVKNNDSKELREACQQFEGIMLDMLYKSMKSTIVKSEFLQSSFSSDMYESMFDEELVKEVAKSSKLGIADTLYKQLSKQTNVQPVSPQQPDGLQQLVSPQSSDSSRESVSPQQSANPYQPVSPQPSANPQQSDGSQQLDDPQQIANPQQPAGLQQQSDDPQQPDSPLSKSGTE